MLCFVRFRHASCSSLHLNPPMPSVPTATRLPSQYSCCSLPVLIFYFMPTALFNYTQKTTHTHIHAHRCSPKEEGSCMLACHTDTHPSFRFAGVVVNAQMYLWHQVIAALARMQFIFSALAVAAPEPESRTCTGSGQCPG